MEAKISIEFNGEKFTLDKRTGYYLKTTKPRKRLHIYIWEYYNGPVPKGCHIYHKDFNKFNNDISNLVCVTKSEHNRIHSVRSESSHRHVCKKCGRTYYSSVSNSVDICNRCDKSVAIKNNQTCEQCGAEYIAKNKAQRFCSNKCKSAWRRKQGLDNIEQICKGCGKIFISNKYHKTVYCSIDCANKHTKK